MQTLTESEYRSLSEQYGRLFEAGMGAEAIRDILASLNMDQLAQDMRNEIRSSSGQRRKKATKRLRVVEAFRKSGASPEWMILTVLPVIPPDREQPFHMFYMLLPSLEARQRLMAHLKSQGILSVFHYVPLHLSEMGRSFGGREGQCPVTEDISDRLLRLPFYSRLTEAQQARVVDAIRDFAV